MTVTRDISRHFASHGPSQSAEQTVLVPNPSNNMLHVALRSTRSSVLTARAVVRPSLALRAISSSAIRRSDDHHAAAPSIYGVGAKPGEVPTDGSQSTGLDRVQVLGLLEGSDVFDLEPLDSSRIGTLADPIKVFSAVGVTLLLRETFLCVYLVL